MAGRLSGKVCIITGSGGSMGRAASLLFASEGARVIGCDVNVESAMETMRLVKAAQGTMASLQPCDLTDAKQCQAQGAILSMTHHTAMEGRTVGIRANSISLIDGGMTAW